MTKAPKIPMSVAELPQQKINLVVDLPPKPAGVTITVGYDVFPEPAMALRPWPRSPTLLVNVEWADSPVHNGIDAYYIEGRKRYWMLWRRWLDDNEWLPKWKWSAAGYCPRRGVEKRAAAVHLLMAYWKMDAAETDAPYDWINGTDFLSVEDVRAISAWLKHC